MNYPQQPMDTTQGMMGHPMGQQGMGMVPPQGMGMMPPQGVHPGMFGPAGMVTLDPDMAPGMVTLDPGNPYPVYPQPVGTCYQPAPVTEAVHTCTCPINYVVKKGDSVYKIAKKFNTTMQAIILANNLSNPDLIYPGQVLAIPRA